MRSLSDANMSWRCPRCCRSFEREGQFHSHDTVDVDDHFAGRDEMLRKSFDRLVGSLSSDFQVDVLKSVIVFSAGTTFALVVVQTRRLLVGVFLGRCLDSPRVVKVDVISSRETSNFVEVRVPDDVDDELRSWLGEAYECDATARRDSD
jgi:Domain of unknown function (DUF5655)